MLANIENLQKAGLPRNEAKVYLELLKQGELSANELSKKLGMDRTLTYGVINNLIEKGLINYIKRENKKIFRAEPPENLLNPLRKKRIFILRFLKFRMLEQFSENIVELFFRVLKILKPPLKYIRSRGWIKFNYS